MCLSSALVAVTQRQRSLIPARRAAVTDSVLNTLRTRRGRRSHLNKKNGSVGWLNVQHVIAQLVFDLQSHDVEGFV